MGKEKIFKRHENRKDIAGEQVLADLAQIIFLAIFLVVWITDFFFVKYSTQFSEYAPLYIRIPLAIVIFIIAGYLGLREKRRDGLDFLRFYRPQPRRRADSS